MAGEGRREPTERGTRQSCGQFRGGVVVGDTHRATLKALQGGVDLPANQLVELEQGKAHMVLRDVREIIRGGDFMKFTMRFEKAGSITFNIQSQIPADEESPFPARYRPASRLPARPPCSSQWSKHVMGRH